MKSSGVTVTWTAQTLVMKSGAAASLEWMSLDSAMGILTVHSEKTRWDALVRDYTHNFFLLNMFGFPPLEIISLVGLPLFRII